MNGVTRMDYEFFSGFTPRIIEVANRNKQVWEVLDYQIVRERTGLHSLGYVYDGEGLLQFDGEKQRLTKGSLFQIWPGEPMQLTSSRSEPLQFYSFMFQYVAIHWDGSDMYSKGPTGKLPLQLGSVTREPFAIESAFRRAYELWSEKNNGYDWHVKLQLLNTLQFIHQQGTRTEDASTSEFAVQKAIQYMKSNYMHELTRDRLAEHVSLSPGYFSVLFRERTGISPIRYLNKIRIDHAKLLLRNSAQSIKQVAEESGFEDSFYFSRLFQKETGMSPRNYRKS